MLYSLYKEIIFIDCLHLLHYHFLLAFGRQNFLRSKRTYSLSSILSWNDFYRLFLGKKFINSSLVNFQISFWQFMVSLFNFAVNKTSSKLSLRIHMHLTVNRLFSRFTISWKLFYSIDENLPRACNNRKTTFPWYFLNFPLSQTQKHNLIAENLLSTKEIATFV